MDYGNKAIKILVIDDDPDNRARLRKKLQTICCDVIMAENDLEGLQLGLIVQPDLILLDTKIKEMGGLSVCERLKRNQNTSEIPIILLVADDDLDEIVIGLEIGASDYVVSPYPLTELKIRIRKALLSQNDKKRVCDAACQSEKNLATKVADELGNTMALIGGFTKPLMKTLSGLEQSIPLHYLEEIMQLTQSGRELVDEYQLLYRSRSVIEDVDPIQLTDTAIQAFHQIIKEKDQSVLVECIQEETMMIKGNAYNLLSALSHLISNAHKFTPRGGQITVAIYYMDKRVRIEITDTGIGIPQALQEMILGNQSNRSGGFNSKRKGMGLGLTIVKSVAEQHRGKIGMESREGKGTRIWIELPAHVQDRDIARRFSYVS